MKTLLADIDILPKGQNFQGKGPLGLEGIAPALAPLTLNSVISSAIGILTIVTFIWFTFKFFQGAYSFVSAGGDKEKLSSAKGTITSAILGVVVVVSAVFLIDLLGSLIGIPNILNPAASIIDIVTGK